MEKDGHEFGRAAQPVFLILGAGVSGVRTPTRATPRRLDAEVAITSVISENGVRDSGRLDLGHLR